MTLGTPPAPARSKDILMHQESPVFARPGSVARRGKKPLPSGASPKPQIPPYDFREHTKALMRPVMSPLVKEVKKQIAEEEGKVMREDGNGSQESRKLRTPKKQSRGFSGPELASPEPLALSAVKRRLRNTPARQSKMSEDKDMGSSNGKKGLNLTRKDESAGMIQFTPLRISSTSTEGKQATVKTGSVNQLRGTLDSSTPMVGPVTRRMARQLEMAEKLG